MEQRKRYRKKYEKIVNDKLEIKFNSLTKEDQEKLMEDLENNPYLRAADDFAVGLAWNAGAELLAPAAFGAGYLVRKFLGLEGDYAKTIKAIAEKNGLEASYLEMADPTSIGGRVVKAFNKVFGQLPFVQK